MSRRGWTIAFWVWCAILFTLTSLPKVPWVGPDTLNWDKLAHAGVYAVFGVLYLHMRKRAGKRSVHELLVIMPVVPMLDELHQLFIPGRQFSLLDWLADMIGIVIAIYTVRAIRKSLQRKEQTA